MAALTQPGRRKCYAEMAGRLSAALEKHVSSKAVKAWCAEGISRGKRRLTEHPLGKDFRGKADYEAVNKDLPLLRGMAEAIQKGNPVQEQWHLLCGPSCQSVAGVGRRS